MWEINTAQKVDWVFPDGFRITHKEAMGRDNPVEYVLQLVKEHGKPIKKEDHRCVCQILRDYPGDP